MAVSVTILGSALHDPGDSQRIYFFPDFSGGFYYGHAHGDLLTLWDLSDPTAIVDHATTSMPGILIFTNHGPSFGFPLVTTSDVTAWMRPIGDVFVPFPDEPETVSVSATGNQIA